MFLGSAIDARGSTSRFAPFVPLARQFADIDLLIVGECDFSDSRFAEDRQALVTQLQAESTAAGCSDRIHWLGLRNNAVKYLQVADLMIFPTRREGLPNAMAEAMACGLPILCIPTPGHYNRLSGA